MEFLKNWIEAISRHHPVDGCPGGGNAALPRLLSLGLRQNARNWVSRRRRWQLSQMSFRQFLWAHSPRATHQGMRCKFFR
ncbi:hypothetical protein [Nostoc linckia]|uniref:hypothetical protein n=1 Tax=Nostoc linckia TaxID=92942 RepID=UPI0015D4C755|nr:hypothetical protein [Nostoc linckia]